MKIYNTLSGKKEELQTLKPHRVNMYVCGPTTYNLIHLGNARPLVVFDTVRRYLKHRGYEVTYIQNFTDVDDKIIKRAWEEQTDPLELASHYIEEYFIDADALGIDRADIHPRVSQHIEDIIATITGLMEKGYAYEVDGNIYYRVRAFADYGKLSGRSVEEMFSGARVEVDERKEEPADFALWKKAKPNEPSWHSPWGEGRPGWHIECSVMATKYLGETIDIHGGGADLIFPHHENEIAQAEAYTGQPFVKYWMHNGFITVNSEKMSKSLGNFFVLRDILAKYPADVIRYYLIATHYRSPLDFDDSKLEEARKALGRLKTTLTLTREFVDDEPEITELTVAGKALLEKTHELEQKFNEAMDDDFNTAMAMGFLFELSRLLNSFMADQDRREPAARTAVKNAAEIFMELLSVLGIIIERDTNDEQYVNLLLKLLLDLRNLARQEKDYALSDAVRDRLNGLNVKVEDNPEGSRFRYEVSPAVDELLEYILAIRQESKAQRQYARADWIRDNLQENGIILEDTREGVRWKFADA
ncbi:Cysteine-tRNA ligase [Syntrophomonas zehnderi OL-4]|uniref:Cysteine--tRNA ligase n=1 Tax=Syntrophomonas zehnderi OL-4 TaxID=690567 RepID=A0A0E4GA74_9FIRM|nr:cysteine--tRNA ligase [Syntrophomonas zehnderi]CFX03969.1 Cysteine-tRNA ligase [Syntrophomonas zehnderi OL-4]